MAAPPDMDNSTRSHHLGDACETLKARAARLITESAEWAPVDVHDRLGLRQRQETQSALLWDMAVAGGGILLRLAVLRLLDSLPRLQTRAFQARSDLRTHLERGQLPFAWRPRPAAGFDVLVVQLFDDCCHTRLDLQGPRTWFGREPEVAATYARFMNVLAEDLAHGQG